jgi:hypothetical protein
MCTSSRSTRQSKVPASISPLDRGQAVDDAVALGIGQHADLGQHGGVGDGAHDVVAIEALVEIDGGGEARDEGVDGFTEAAAPGLIGLVGAHGFARDRLKRVT